MSKAANLAALASDRVRFTSGTTSLEAGYFYVFNPSVGINYYLTLPATAIQGQKISFRNKSERADIKLLRNGNLFEGLAEDHDINDLNAKGSIMLTNDFGWIYIND